jgi:hypothetical protein
MSEEKQKETPQQSQWEDIGQQFRALGESLAAAIQATWENETTQKHVESVKTGMTEVANDISAAIKNAADSEEGQRVKVEAQKAGEEIRPHLLNAFRKIKEGLDQIITDMEDPDDPAGGSKSETTSE